MHFVIKRPEKICCSMASLDQVYQPFVFQGLSSSYTDQENGSTDLGLAFR